MRSLPTWRAKSEFSYSGSVKDGTTLYYGAGNSVRVTASQYLALLNHFKGREVEIGTSRDAAPKGSVGAWLQEHVTRTAIASYVGPILLDEGYAVRGSTLSKIRFI